MHTEQARGQAEAQTETLRRQVGELQQLQQQNSRRNASVNQSGGASELIRARALEAAREEIKELREAEEQTKIEMEKVVQGRKQVVEQLTLEKEQLNDRYQALELQLEKQKIFVSAHKRDMEAAQADLQKVKEDCDSKIAETERAKEAAVEELRAKV